MSGFNIVPNRSVDHTHHMNQVVTLSGVMTDRPCSYVRVHCSYETVRRYCMYPSLFPHTNHLGVGNVGRNCCLENKRRSCFLKDVFFISFTDKVLWLVTIQNQFMKMKF
jgi:hypothetical protein